ncbi:MAG: RsmB/NOP family class I SAM-dependent RNA methyltransferase, partial [Opitutus sp.]
DTLLDTLPRTFGGPGRARCHHLVLGVIRHFGRIDAALGGLVAHPPRFSTRAVLFVAGFELLEAMGDGSQPPADGQVAKIVHHAVEQTKALASPAEARLVNAVARKLATILAQPVPAAGATAGELAVHYSHPAWLIQNWQAQFGPEATRSLLAWNQTPAPVHARWRDASTAPPKFLKETEWPDFFEVESGHWGEVEPLLKARQLYLQDPSTRIPVELLELRANESVADLCAAPGGKSLLIADRMKTGRLVAIDMPGQRIERLKENLSRAGAVEVALVQGDVLKDIGVVLQEHRLPGAYDAVLLDVPCSNTGVMRHRVDVKWRIQPGDFKKHPRQQLSMLHAAARLTAANGRLVYSTCSIDSEENEHVVRSFLASKAGGPFSLEATVLSFPWTNRHDGGAAFRLRRS